MAKDAKTEKCIGCKRGPPEVQLFTRDRCMTCYRDFKDPTRAATKRIYRPGGSAKLPHRVDPSVAEAFEREAKRRGVTSYALAADVLTNAAKRW